MQSEYFNSTIDRPFVETFRYLRTKGVERESRDGSSVETTGFSMRMLNCSNVVLNEARKFSPWYAAAELIWYLSGTGSIEALVPYAPQYKRFADKQGEAFGAYGIRLMQHGQLKMVIDLLKKTPNTRQAILSIFSDGDLAMACAGTCPDIPCTLSLQFLIVEDQLDCITTMRSNDLWLGFPYDVFCFSSLQCLIASVLNLEVGTYVHNVGCMHYYKRETARLLRCESSTQELSVGSWTYENRFDIPQRFFDSCKELTLFEKMVREGEHLPGWIDKQVKNAFGPKSLMRDLVICCGLKWGKFEPSDLSNPDLEKAACLSLKAPTS